MKKSPITYVFFLFSLVAGFYQQAGARLTINEIMASNVLSYENSDGNYEDWIEIHNSGNSPVNLMGYYLTDNLAGQNYWQIPAGQASKTTVPAHGFLVFLADNDPEKGANHLSFRLDKNSEQIVLIDQDGVTVIDSVTYAAQITDVSFGRFPDGTGSWQFMDGPTPAAANTTGYAGVCPEPFIVQTPGFFSGNAVVSVQAARSGDVIRYTLDGEDPEAASAQYTGPVQLTRTGMFKARAFRTGDMPSTVAAKSFFVNDDRSLPVLALITDPDNLFDPETGIYVNDKNGRKWERPCVLEYFAPKQLGFHEAAGIRIQGNTGPQEYNKKSFRVYFREGYGSAKLEYALYPNDSVAEFNNLVLRSGYDDSMEPTAGGKNTHATLLRDPVVTELWRRTGALTPLSSLSVLYLNANFHGVYDIKQSIDETFVRDHLGVDKLDLVRTRWDSTELVFGQRDEWNSLVRFFEDNAFTTDAKVAEAASKMDLRNFIDLLALTYATEYKGWGYGSFMIRPRTAGARWTWTIWDADRSFNDPAWNGFTNQYNPLGTILDNLFTKKLLQNPGFRNDYINRIADLFNTLFAPANVKAIIDSLAAQAAPEIPSEAAKWNNTVAKWNENVEFLRAFADQRPAVVRQQMLDYFQLRGTWTLTLGVERGDGKILVNTVSIARTPWTGAYFQGIPVTVTAVPGPGYRFSGWSDASVPSAETITLNPSADVTLSAAFTPIGPVNAELLAPARIRSGQRLPVVVRIRDGGWGINPLEQTPMQVKFGGAHADTAFLIKRGAGTGVVRVQSASDFTLTAGNANVPETRKTIAVPASYPSVSVSGTLPVGDVVWDGTSDRIVVSNVTVPAGCRLTIKAGTWVLFQRYAGMNVRGQLVVEGTESEPVVFAPENWSDPWGGLEFQSTSASFRYCFFVNGGGDPSKGRPTDEDWHTGHQHILFAKDDTDLRVDNCFFLNSTGKAFGAQDSKVTVTQTVSSFVWHGGEFHRVLLFYQNSHLMNLPNDDHIYTEDIDTDGFHIDYVNPKYNQPSVIDRCWFVTGKDDAIDHHYSRLRISNCWLEDFIHEGVAASGGDTLRIFNTVALNCDQGFEVGWVEGNTPRGPIMVLDHCVAVGNNNGLRIGDSYSWTYRGFLKATNVVLSGNQDNIRNYLNSTQGPLAGAIDISYSMTNDADYDGSPHCITGTPALDPLYYLLPGSPGAGRGTAGTNMGRADSTALRTGSVVINEIMYNAPDAMDTKDWIELYNPQSVDQDVSGWTLKDDDDGHAFLLPAGTVIPAGGYWMVCADTAAFKEFHPDATDRTGDVSFGFGGNDAVRLFAATGDLVDSVAYDNGGSWPGEADGNGPSLELLSPARDNALPESWAKSLTNGGTPGRANRRTGVENRPEQRLPERFALEQNYPNPFNPVTRFGYSLPRAGTVRLVVYDLRGREVLRLADGLRRSAGRYRVELDARSLASGMYIYRIDVAYNDRTRDTLTRKMVLIK